MRFKVLIYTVSAALLLGGVEAVASAGGPKGLRQAVNLYEKGFYSEAKAFFDQKDDLLAGDYSALCSAALGERGSLEGLIGRLEAHPESVLAPEIRRTAGDLLFAEGRYIRPLRSMPSDISATRNAISPLPRSISRRPPGIRA